jgi:hypothetical protein
MTRRNAWLAFLSVTTQECIPSALAHMHVGNYSLWVMVHRNTNHDSLNMFTDQNPQVYGTIIIAFHLGVFQGIVIYIFPKEGKVFVSSIGINIITYLHDGHSL